MATKLQDVLAHGDKQVVVMVDLLARPQVAVVDSLTMVAVAGQDNHLSMVVQAVQVILEALALAVAAAVADQTVLVVAEATLVAALLLGLLVVLVVALSIMVVTNQMLILLMVVKATLRLQDFN
jgi:hypothetical protein